MPKVEIRRPRLHDGQKLVVAGSKRFNVLRNGRRWGKTKLAVRLAIDTIVKGGPVGYFVPTFDFCEEFWEEIKERLEPLISYKSESKHLLRFYTGAELKVWSMEKKRAGRGKKYARVIIDEGAFAKDLKESWEKAIRATLTDLQGDAWFLSTPYGTDNYFNKLFDNAGQKKFENWIAFTMPTNTNPYISKAELKELEEQLDELTWLQEFMAIVVDFNNKPFAYSFDKELHVKEFGPPIKKYPLYLAFDFNVDPITCLVCQHDDEKNKIRIHKEYRLDKSDTYKLCDRIIADWGDYFFMVTGDASGSNTNTMVKDNKNNYDIIKQKLALELGQLKVPKSNPRIRNSRVLTNSLLSRHPSILIHPRCKFLVEDLKFVEVTDTGEIDKKKDKRRAHLIDCLRYYFNSFHWEFIKLYHE